MLSKVFLFIGKGTPRCRNGTRDEQSNSVWRPLGAPCLHFCRFGNLLFQTSTFLIDSLRSAHARRPVCTLRIYTFRSILAPCLQAPCECSHPGWDPGLGPRTPRKGPGSQGPRGTQGGQGALRAPWARAPSAPLGPMGPVGVIPKLFRMGVILREASVGVHLQSKEQITNSNHLP